jgi:diguanylate cyclase (GGDEF)-like protein/PAS domain S-box-containing protein
MSLARLVELEAPDMTLVLDPSGRIAFASAGTERVVGWDRAELTGQSPAAYVDPDDETQVLRDLTGAKCDPPSASTFRFRCLGGSLRWVEARFRRAPDGSGHVIVALRDISERESAAVALREQLAIDPLTGVSTRVLFADRLQHALRRLVRTPGRVAVLMLDVDHFKVVNDALGHAGGDQVLTQMAGRLLAQLRPGDTLARLGGDEFAILAEDVDDPEGALRLAERITAAAQVPLLVGDEHLVCTVSIGVALTDRAGHRPEVLLRQADLALYRAKARGRDRAELFDEELRTLAVSRLAVERMLRRAMHEQRIRVEYQPVVSLRERRVVGAEALVRVHDPHLDRLVLPDQFLDVAEETGMLKQIDDLVLAAAARDCAIWNGPSASPDVWVTVNVTARNLSGGRLLEKVLSVLSAQESGAHLLRVEMTEQVLLSATHSAISTLHAIREAGVRVGLDDFGTGYSAIAYLRQLPLDFVKLDNSLIDGIAPGSTDLGIAQGLIGLCHAMGLEVVAEGVETQEQDELLRAAGCDLAQGFLYGGSTSALDLVTRIGGPPQQRTP